MNNYEEIQDAAYSYINFDLPIIPLCSHNHRGCSDQHKDRCKSPGKAPLLKNWSQHMHTDEEHLEEWFSTNRYINIGLVLGQTDDWNIVGVDIDGELGEQLFQELTKTNDVPDTWEYSTGGGRRLLYMLPDGVQTQKHKVAWKEGHEELAFLAQGQQTVLPPSIHPSGSRYLWVDGHSPIDSDLAMAPPWIIQMVQREDVAEDLPWSNGPLSTPVVMEEFTSTTGEGDRSNHMTRFVGTLCAKRTISKEVIIQTAMQQNLLYCDPPLSQGEVEAMVESIYNSEMQKHQKMLQNQRRRQELHPLALAESFEKDLNKRGVFWMYNQDKGKIYRTTSAIGPWVMLAEESAHAEISTFIAGLDASLATMSKVTEVYKQMIIRSINKNGPGDELNLGDHPYTEEIALENGILQWKTGKLVPWDPKYRHTAIIEATWKEDIQQTEAWMMWNEALSQWLPNPKTIEFLQEYIGYALLPSCKMRTAVFLYGEGANGKSLFLDVVNLLFSKSSIVTNPTALSSRFGTAVIIDKLLVVCSDIDATFLDKTGTLKQIIAGDRVRAEYKGGKEFDFVPVCKLLFSANKLPRSADRTHGWYSRLQIVEFPHQFAPDTKYYTKLLTTMASEEGRAALLAWAVEGLQRITNNQKWTSSPDMIQAKKQYRIDNDNVLAFMDACLEPHPFKEGSYKTSLVTKAVYLTYKEWCAEAGVRCVGQQEFTQRVGSTYKKKALRWKTPRGWRTQNSLIDVRFSSDKEFDMKESYEMNVAVHCN